jgi:hypothetical protein
MAAAVRLKYPRKIPTKPPELEVHSTSGDSTILNGSGAAGYNEGNATSAETDSGVGDDDTVEMKHELPTPFAPYYRDY